VGDGLKEIREYQRMVDDYIEQKRHLAAHPGAHREGPAEENIAVGFYRASKYEMRMKEVLECLMTSLRGPAQQASSGDAHCAQVNQIVRHLLSRGESETHVGVVPKP
jgi:hypothetical protein